MSRDRVLRVQAVLAEKDAAVLEYHQENQRLKQQLAASRMDSERASLAVLSAAVEERDGRIAVLKQHLTEADIQMESASQQLQALQGRVYASTQMYSSFVALVLRVHSLVLFGCELRN